MTGSPTNWIAASLESSLTPQPGDPYNTTRHAENSHADIATHPGSSTAGRSAEQPGILGVAQFSAGDSHQGSIPDHVLDSPEQFDDAPYVPPRVGLQTYSALDPRVGSAYDDIHHYPYAGGTSPSESHHSVESGWSHSSSSSASSQRPSHDYLAEHAFSQASPTHPRHYPAYHGQHRIGPGHLRCGEQPSNTGGTYYRVPHEGYAIDNLLSSEIFEDTNRPSQPDHPASLSQGSSSSNQLPGVSTFSVTPTPVETSRLVFPDAGPQLRQQLGLGTHERIDLHALPDPSPGEKPSTPLPMLVKLAIYGSRSKQLTLQEIYTELENRFEWFREHTNDKAWKNSIRHNLSLNKVFKHVPRPITEPGKGSYWQLDMSEGEGYKRLRKRRTKNRILASEEEDEEMPEEGLSPLDSHHAGPSRSSATPVDEGHLDPELRSEGHVVGEGRSRSVTRRTSGGSPYPSQSPRYQQGPLPVVATQDAGIPGQPVIRFGQPSFGQSSFLAHPQTRPMQAASSSFATMPATSMAMAQPMSTIACPQIQHVGSYDRSAQIPSLHPRAGIEYVVGPGGLPAARRVDTYIQEFQGQSQGDTVHSSPESSSSGSSRTWNDARSRG